MIGLETGQAFRKSKGKDSLAKMYMYRYERLVITCVLFIFFFCRMVKDWLLVVFSLSFSSAEWLRI